MSNLNNSHGDQEDLSTAKCNDGYTEAVVTPTHDLTQGSIPRHFRKMAIPMAIGMVFNTLYSVVDTLYAGFISTSAQAGLSIASQVFFFLIALGFGLSSAMGALVGNAYGEGLQNKGNQIAQQGAVFGVFMSMVLTILGFIFAPELIELISTDSPYREDANAYLNLILLGTVFFLLGFGVNGILQARGDTKSMTRAQIAAFFANLVLNPLFIFGIPGLMPGFGFNGLALSTLVSQAGVMTYMLHRLYKSGVLDTMKIDIIFKPDWTIYRSVLAQAIPASFTMMVMIAAGFVIQFFLKEFGSQAVAGYGIAMRLEQLVFLPVFGLTGSLMPLAAQNFGAGNYDRVREAAFFCFKTGCAMMVLSCILLWVLGPIAMSLFTKDPEVIRIGVSYLRVSGLVHWAYLMLMAVNSLLQAFKKPVWNLGIGIYRQGIGVALFSYIYVTIFDMGVLGIWIGIATSVVTGLVLALSIVQFMSKKMMGASLFDKQPTKI